MSTGTIRVLSGALPTSPITQLGALEIRLAALPRYRVSSGWNFPETRTTMTLINVTENGDIVSTQEVTAKKEKKKGGGLGWCIYIYIYIYEAGCKYHAPLAKESFTLSAQGRRRATSTTKREQRGGASEWTGRKRWDKERAGRSCIGSR